MKKTLAKLWLSALCTILIAVFISLVYAGSSTSSPTANLSIWDDTDTGVKYINDSIFFYANYTNATGASLNGSNINCSISFNYTGSWSAAVNISFNSSSSIYYHNATINVTGESYFNITCSAPGYDTLSLAENVTIANSIPTKPTYIYPGNNTGENFVYNFNETIPINCSGSTDLETAELNYSIQTYLNSSETGWVFDWLTLTTNLTNETTYNWDLSAINTSNTSQFITLHCKAFDGTNYSEALANKGSIALDRPPVFNTPLANMSWLEDTANSSLNLSAYFSDPDGDKLNYTSTGHPNISVAVNNDTGIVTFTPNQNFHGTNTIVFYAWDRFGLNATSNNITLTIINTPEVNLSSPANGSSGYANTDIEFYLQVEDDFLIKNCSLYINGTLNLTKTGLNQNTSLEAFNDTGSASSSDDILTTQRIKRINLSSTNYTGFKAHLVNNNGNGEGPIIVSINNNNLFNITASEVHSTASWVSKIITNTSILVKGENNITFEDKNYSISKKFKLSKDSNGEYLVRLTNNIINFNTTTLNKGTYSWNATCHNIQNRSKWSTETWQFTVNNSAPSTPTSLTPTSGTFDSEINISCSGSTDIDGDSITYTLKYRDQTFTWHTITTDDADGNYTWNITGIVSGTSLYFSCFASDGSDNSDEYTPSTSRDVKILHSDSPTTPTNITCNNLDCNNKVFTDEINLSCSGSNDSNSNFTYVFEGRYADWNGTQWYAIAVVNASNGNNGTGSYRWNTTAIINQSNISIKCFADDGSNAPSASISAANISVNHTATAPGMPASLNYSTDFMYEVNITANGSTDPDGDSITYRIWARYDTSRSLWNASWRLINATLTNTTIFRWNVSSLPEQTIDIKAQATDGTYYSNFLNPSWTIRINRPPTLPTNVSPVSGVYEYEVNYSCAGSNNTEFFTYYVEAYYNNGTNSSWRLLNDSFPGVPLVNESNLAFGDGIYNSITNQPVNANSYWRFFSINVSNRNYSYCVNGYGTGSGPQFKLYWNCNAGDTDGSTCSGSDASYTSLTTSDATYCADISLNKSGVKYLKIRTKGDGSSGRISTYFDYAYLVAKPYKWNVTSIPRQRNVRLRCKATDSRGNSSWFIAATNFSIDRVPMWNASKQLNYSTSTNNTIVWKEDSNLVNLFNLDEYFYDPDNDTLNYSVAGNSNINIIINSTTSNVSFYPNSNWHGTEYVTFLADDNITNGTSPTITLIVSNDCADGGECTGGGGGGTSPAPTTTENKLKTKEESRITESKQISEAESNMGIGGSTDIKGTMGTPLNNNFVWERDYHITSAMTEITERIKYMQMFSEENARLRIDIPKKVIGRADSIVTGEEFRIVNVDPSIEFELGTFNAYDIKERRYSIEKKLSVDDVKSIAVKLFTKPIERAEIMKREQEIEKARERAKEAVNVTTTVEIYENGSAEIFIDVDLIDNETIVKGLNLPINIPKCLIEILKREYKEQLIDSDIDLTILKEDPEVNARFDLLDKDTRFSIRIKNVADVNCSDSVEIAPTVAEIVRRLGKPPSPKDYIALLLFIGFWLVIGLVFSKENVEKMQKIALRQRLFAPVAWVGKRIIFIFFLILLALSILDIFGILGDFDFVKKMLSILLAIILLSRARLSEKLFGRKNWVVTLLLMSLWIVWFTPTLENLLSILFREYGIFGGMVKTLNYLFMNYQSVIHPLSFMLFALSLAFGYYLVSQAKESSVATILIGENKSPIKKLIVVAVIITSFFIIFQMIIEGFAIATDSFMLMAVILFFIALRITKKSKSKEGILSESFESVDRFIEDFIDLFRYERTIWLAVSIRVLFILSIGFIVFYIIGHVPYLHYPEIYETSPDIDRDTKLHNLFFEDIRNTAVADIIPLFLIYIMNAFALGGFFVIPLFTFIHLICNTLNEFDEQKKLTFNRWFIVIFMMSVAAFALMPAYTIKPIGGETITGINIAMHTLPKALIPNIMGLLIAIVTTIFTLLHFKRKRKEATDILTHLAPLPFLLAYAWLFFTKTQIELGYWAILLAPLSVGIWAVVFTKKHKRIAEHKTIAFVFIFMALYFGVYVYDFLFANIRNLTAGLLTLPLASPVVLANYGIEWLRFVVYFLFHLYVLFAFGYELHLSNEFGIHKYHIRLLDKRETKSYLKLSKYTPELKDRYKKEARLIRKELDKGMIKNAEPHHIIIYLLNHSHDLNLINDIIRKDKELNKYYHEGVAKVMSEEIQEIIRGEGLDDIELVARELNQLYCSTKLITAEINKSQLKEKEKKRLIHEYRMLWLKLLFRHHPEHAVHTALQNGFKQHEIEEARRIVKEVSPLVKHINYYKKSRHRIADLLREAREKGWPDNLIKEAMYLSNADIGILGDEKIQKAIKVEGRFRQYQV
jgi:hypothetical protein